MEHLQQVELQPHRTQHDKSQDLTQREHTMCFHRYDVCQQVKVEVTLGREGAVMEMGHLGFFVNLVDGYTCGFSL